MPCFVMGAKIEKFVCNPAKDFIFLQKKHPLNDGCFLKTCYLEY